MNGAGVGSVRASDAHRIREKQVTNEMKKHRVTREDAVRYLVLRSRSLALLLFGGRHDSASDAAEKSPKPRCVAASVRYRAASLSFHRSASERSIRAVL